MPCPARRMAPWPIRFTVRSPTMTVPALLAVIAFMT